jgi:hypothetical protein
MGAGGAVHCFEHFTHSDFGFVSGFDIRHSAFSIRSLAPSKNRAKNVRQLLRFLCKTCALPICRFVPIQLQEAKPVSALLGLFAARLDLEQEVLLPERFVRFDIVRADRTGGTNELLCILDTGKGSGKRFYESADLLCEFECPLLEIVAVFVFRISTHLSTEIHSRKEIRNPNIEIRNKLEYRNSNKQMGRVGYAVHCFEHFTHSDFGFVSGFDIRHSDFPSFTSASPAADQ